MSFARLAENSVIGRVVCGILMGCDFVSGIFLYTKTLKNLKKHFPPKLKYFSVLDISPACLFFVKSLPFPQLSTVNRRCILEWCREITWLILCWTETAFTLCFCTHLITSALWWWWRWILFYLVGQRSDTFFICQ